MKKTLNLIFKKTTCIDGITKVNMRIVPVTVEDNEIDDSWILASSCDEITDGRCVDVKTSDCTTTVLYPGDKYDSTEQGTARLIRRNNQIFIAYRKGKKTLNQNTPDSVCISDNVKFEYFNDTRNCGIYIHSDNPLYNKWSKIIDITYIKGLDEYNKKNHIKVENS